MISYANSHHRFPVKPRVYAAGLLILFCLAPLAKAQQPELDLLAGDTASAITRDSQYLNGGAKVLVLDFNLLHEPPGELGKNLANRFSDSLKQQSRGFTVIDRQDYFAKFGEGSLAATSYDSAGGDPCLSAQLDANATAFVEGSYEILPDTLSLWIKLLRDKEMIFQKRITLPLTPELQSLASKTVPEFPGLTGEIDWTNSERPRIDGQDAPILLDQGHSNFKSPTCLHCPPPDFSDAAREAKVQGTAILEAEIDSEGFPVRIAVLKGLPCGLTKQAVAAASNWKFTPAIDPQGKPVPVITIFEVTFRLF